MKSILYDEAYAQRFRERADTDLGRKIYACRWKLVEEYCHGPLRLLDYGCGPGAFHTVSTNGFVTRGYDINPHCGYPSMPKGQFDIVTMWDVIEHLDSPVAVIRDLDPTWLFICTPNLHTADTISTW